MSVNKITNETVEKMRNKSVEKLPDVVKNMPPQELKRKFTGLAIDSSISLVSEINRIVDETNVAIKNTPHIITSDEMPEDLPVGGIWRKVYKVLDDE